MSAVRADHIGGQTQNVMDHIWGQSQNVMLPTIGEVTS